MDLRPLFALTPHGPDTFIGSGRVYPWGGLYGGHIVAQALRAAAETVDAELLPHSLRAYFIRRGDHAEPVRYEVDRLRNGRSFCTRRVVARQAIGAILNLEASFQVHEQTPDVMPVSPPSGVPSADELTSESWTPAFDRCFVPRAATPPAPIGAGRALAWLRATDELGDDELLQRCVLAYLSDDLPTDAVVRAHPEWADDTEHRGFYSASLDHTIWFHRPVRADRWHLHDFSCLAFTGARGLSIGQIFDEEGDHVATVAQEVLLRPSRR